MLEAHGGDSYQMKSPGGFEFGLQGWQWPQPVLRSITFFLDNTCLCADQFGRPMKGIQLDNGAKVLFADRAPEDRSRFGEYVTPRPQFATHAQVISAFAEAERIDVIAEINKFGDPCKQCKGMKTVGNKWCPNCFHKDSGESTGLQPAIQYVGWPQLPYETLRKLKRLPMTPEAELEKIVDPAMRKAALRIRREHHESKAKEKELQEVE